MTRILIDGIEREIDAINLRLKPLAEPQPDIPPVVIPDPPKPKSLVIGGVEIAWPVPEPVAPPIIKDISASTMVNSANEFNDAVKFASDGDRIIIEASAVIAELRIDSAIGTYERPLQIVAQPGAQVHKIKLIGSPFVQLIGVGPLSGGIYLNFNTHHIDAIACTIKTHTDIDPNLGGIYITNQDGGGFRFINNFIEHQDPNAAKLPYAGINFAAGRDVGPDVRIAGCALIGYKDGLSCGQMLYKIPTRNMLIENNFALKCRDDAFECDGWHENLIVRNNVIGGTASRMIGGISIAPGGPGPILIEGNSIAGLGNDNGVNPGELPIKVNTSVMGDARMTKNVTIKNNRFVQVSEKRMMQYFAWPVHGMENFTIVDNEFYSRGGFMSFEGYAIPGLVLDRNKYFTTLEFKDHGKLWRFYDEDLQSNISVATIGDLKRYFGHEISNSGFQFVKIGQLPTPAIPIPGFDPADLCRFEAL